MSNSNVSILSRIGGGITKLRNFFVNTLFLAILVLITVALLTTCQGITVPDNAALVINPRGVIVDAATVPDPFEELLTAGPRLAEVELRSLLRAIELATTDAQIKMIVLDLDKLAWAAPAHAQRIGEALVGFQMAGKKVVSYGQFYSQAQYYIASFADALYLHPMGQIVFEGFGGFSFYFKDLLDKFDVNVHVFRVGDYKSAVEPFTRNDMSEESRLASEQLYQEIWQHFLRDISRNRLIEKPALQSYADNLAGILDVTQGDMARAALESQLVDELLTSDQANVRIADDVGFRNRQLGEINGIDFQTYLNANALYEPAAALGKAKIAEVVVQGIIMNQGQSNQIADAESVIRLIRQARDESAVKALVLRVDSPGGSQFASELIRQELELLQLAGKPVVASFGASAASGGYWISATADAIVAEPTSITGSIGIFSFIPTFEETLQKYGVYTDGVGTTELTGSLNPFTGINQPMADILQAQVEHGYAQFLALVARGRDMSLDQVDAVAQGRVWTGETAKQLGLVDDLGGIRLAQEKAAELAGLDDWEPIRLLPPIDPRAAFLAELMMPEARTKVTKTNVLTQLQQGLSVLAQFDDPTNSYVLCESCLGSNALNLLR
ncbi:MAG: signal peptide peptidase SppA [Pseudomonadaceae bacterium]|nr:signal peptide peptidase SppA [Pseudomonadaceae bacterium]